MYQRCHSDILVYSFLATLSKIELYLAVMHIVDDCTLSSSHQTFIMFRVLMNRFPPSNRVPHGALTGSNEEIQLFVPHATVVHIQLLTHFLPNLSKCLI